MTVSKRTITGFDVDPLSAESIGLVTTLHAAIFSDAGETPWDEDAFRSLLANPNYHGLCYHLGDAPVGMLLYSEIVGEAEIITVGVIPEARGKGFGKTIIKRLIQTATDEKWDNIHLEVRADNQPAIQLYSRIGFIKIGVRADYYKLQSGKRLDAYLMAYSLQAETKAT